MTITIERPVEHALTADEAYDLLQQIVADAPDTYRYVDFWREHIDADTHPECLYTAKGKPACIVGQALNRLDLNIPEDHRTSTPGETQNGNLFHRVWAMRDDIRERISYEAMLVLRTAQSAQDGGTPWRTAVDEAKPGGARYIDTEGFVRSFLGTERRDLLQQVAASNA